jgi:hypothetical protein
MVGASIASTQAACLTTTGTHATKWPPRAQRARPAGRYL